VPDYTLTAEWETMATARTRIWEVLGLNLSIDTGCRDQDFFHFPQSLQASDLSLILLFDAI
jgi:hypothetical protein